MSTTQNSVLIKMLDENVVRLGVEGLETPQEVIEYSGNLLKEAGKVNEQYVKDMVDAYNVLGAYIVMAPGLAMPHARPGGNVMENAISFVQLKQPVEFHNPSNDPVRVVIALAGASDNGHIDILQELSGLLGLGGIVEKLAEVSSYKELITMIEKEGRI